MLSATVVLAGFGGSAAAQQGAERTFQKQVGDWKADCFKEPGDEKPYCRIMAVKLLDGVGPRNFLQVGPAFDRDQKGIVIATYLGFTGGSKILLAVDGDEPETLNAPAKNNVIAPADLSARVIERMETGKEFKVRFRPATGTNQQIVLDLSGYQALLPEVKAQL